MPANRVRVLVVDDSEEATQLLSLLLERRGHDVRVAHDVEAALRVAQEFTPEVALLDIMIRCESGFFLAQRLLELPGLDSCRLIAMSGFELEQHSEVSEAIGFRRQLRKPIEPARLFDAVETTD